MEEDIGAQFFLMKARMYGLVHGQEAWSWWDPLFGLGLPRFADIQYGWFCPVSLWFMLVPPEWAWRLYPLGIDILLTAAAIWAGSELQLKKPWLCAWLAVTWTQCQVVLFETQHPPYKESMLAALLAVASALAWWRNGRRRYLVALAASGFMHITAGNPSAMYFDHFCLGCLLPWLVWCYRPGRKRLALSLLAYCAGCLLASPVLLAMLDYHGHSERKLPEVAGTTFAESYRYTAGEITRRLASETLAGPPVAAQFYGGYAVPTDLSLAATLLALSALAVPRLRWLTGISLVLVYQAVGERAGLVWLVHQILPFSQDVRGPGRYFLFGSWGLLLAAALAWQHWESRGPAARRLCRLLAAWAVLLPLGLHSTVSYASPEILNGPEWPAGPGRVSALRYSRPSPPLLWECLPVLQGRRTLLLPQVPYEGGFLLGLACSQLGADAPEHVGALIAAGRKVPVLRPQVPLLMSWGLTWVLEGAGQPSSFRFRRLQSDPPRFWWSQVVDMPAPVWAARQEGDPFATAIVEGGAPGTPVQPGLLMVERDDPDFQRISVQGSGLLLASDQWDPGWHCRIDGRPVPTLRANYALKACWVPPGSRTVDWEYRPSWLGWALLCHLAGWALLLLSLRLASRRATGVLGRGLRPVPSPPPTRV